MSQSRTYKLLVDSEVQIGLYVEEHGRRVFRPYRMKPDYVYSLDSDPVYGDERVIKQLKDFRVKKSISKSLEDKLKLLNIPYEYVRCRSCGGLIKKIEYNPIEVTE